VSELEQLLGELSGRGRADSRGFFTLKLERALELLARHRHREPESYVLHVVAAAVAGGARWLDVRLLNGRAVFVYEGHLLTAAEREWFLQSPLLPESPAHLRELALALLSAGALPGAEIVLRSEAGVHIRRGRVEPGPTAERNELEVRTRRNWWWHARARGPELAYLERFCRHCPVPITVNGAPLGAAAPPAVACLELGPEGTRDLPPNLEAGYRNWREFPWRGWVALGVDLGFPAPLCLRRHGVLVPVERELPIPCQVLVEADLPCDLEGKPVQGPELARLFEELRPNLAMLAFEVVWQELGSLELRQELLRGLMRIAPGRVDELRVLRTTERVITLRELEQAFEERGFLCVVEEDGDFPDCWGPVVIRTPVLGPALWERFPNLVVIETLRGVQEIPRLPGELLVRMPVPQSPGEVGLTLEPRREPFLATLKLGVLVKPLAYRALAYGAYPRTRVVSDHALSYLKEGPEELERLVWGDWPHDDWEEQTDPLTQPLDSWVRIHSAPLSETVGCTTRVVKLLKGGRAPGTQSTWDVLEATVSVLGAGLAPNAWRDRLSRVAHPSSRALDWKEQRENVMLRAREEAFRYRVGLMTPECLMLALSQAPCQAREAILAAGVTTEILRRDIALRGSFQTALSDLNDLCHTRPGAPVYVMRATFSAWRGRLEHAARDVERALEHNPRSYWARVLEGQILLSRGLHDEAREAFELAATRRVDGPEAQQGLGWCAYLEGQWAPARQHWRGFPGLRAMLCMEEGDLAQALILAEQALKKDPYELPALFSRAHTLERLRRPGDAEQAYALYTEAQELFPVDPWWRRR